VRLPAPEPGGPAPAGTGWPEAFGAEAGDATADRDAWEPWEPWDEAATRPLTAQRAAALERERDPAVLLRLLGRSRNPYEQVEILGLLWSRHGEQLPTDRVGGLRAGLDALYRRACQLRLWGVLRRAAGWLERPEPGLEAAVTQILVQHKRLALGRAYSEGAILSAPTTQAGILARVQAYGGADVRARVLIQEVVQLLALLMKAEPGLFRGTLTLRPWSFVILLNGWLAREHGVSQAEAFDHLLDLSPHALLVRLREVIRREQDMATDLLRLHHLDVAAGGEAMQTVSYSPASDPPLADDEGGWQAWRETTGAITRVPAWFHARVWELLRHCNGLVIADQFDLRNRLDSKLLRADMTRAEIGFALQVDDLLHKITAPEYRQLTIEAVTVLADLAAANPALQVDGLFVVDVVIGTAVRLGWQAARRESERDAPEGREGPSVQAYREHIAEAWQAFYASPPHRVANHLVAAARLLLSPGTALPAADTARSMPA
jgi:phosphorylase kinase alpha/beta subunit